MFVFIVYVLKYKNVYTFVGFKTEGMVMLYCCLVCILNVPIYSIRLSTIINNCNCIKCKMLIHCLIDKSLIIGGFYASIIYKYL